MIMYIGFSCSSEVGALCLEAKKKKKRKVKKLILVRLYLLLEIHTLFPKVLKVFLRKSTSEFYSEYHIS